MRNGANLEAFPRSLPQVNHSFRDAKDSLNYFVNSGDGGYPSTVAECSKEMLR